MLVISLGAVAYSHKKKPHLDKRVEIVEASSRARDKDAPEAIPAAGDIHAGNVAGSDEGFLAEYGILTLGILTALSLFITIGFGLFRMRLAGWFRYHRVFAIATACLMVIHASVAVWEHYFQ